MGQNRGFIESSTPMVDIIIPFYNRKALVKRAIKSVQNQSFQDWKLWMVDDGSSDGAIEELKKEFESQKIQFIQLDKNQGVSAARNQGIKLGHNSWVAFLDSDDEWLPQKLEKQMQYLKQYPETVLIHCNETWVKDNKVVKQKKKHKKPEGRAFNACVLLCCISPSATVIRRKVLESLDFFREDFPVCEDYDLWLKVTSKFDIAFLEESLLIKHGGHKDQLSRAYPIMDYWRVKALAPYLTNVDLSLSERQQVKQVLLERCDILLKGYQKHQNFKNQKEVELYIDRAKKCKIPL